MLAKKKELKRRQLIAGGANEEINYPLILQLSNRGGAASSAFTFAMKE